MQVGIGAEGEGERERIQDKLCTECEALDGDWGLIPQPWDHDLSQTKSRTLNWLNHSGTPLQFYFYYA